MAKDKKPMTPPSNGVKKDRLGGMGKTREWEAKIGSGEQHKRSKAKHVLPNTNNKGLHNVSAAALKAMEKYMPKKETN
jgi:hypothetical protein|tara:strand:+ start:2156 stop:2389 length:234 start_codon:yes stop_codon:yes gene_type:complete